MLADSGGRRVLSDARPQIVHQKVHRHRSYLVWLLSKLTVEVRMIIGVKAALEGLVFEERSKKRAAIRGAPIWSPQPTLRGSAR